MFNELLAEDDTMIGTPVPPKEHVAHPTCAIQHSVSVSQKSVIAIRGPGATDGNFLGGNILGA